MDKNKRKDLVSEIEKSSKYYETSAAVRKRLDAAKAIISAGQIPGDVTHLADRQGTCYLCNKPIEYGWIVKHEGAQYQVHDKCE